MLEIEVFVDGACSGNPGVGGWAYFLPQKGLTASGAEENTTNNQMELTAILRALEYIENAFPAALPVRFFCDSAYCVNGLTSWIYGWERNGWKTANKQPVKNKELWQAIHAFCRGREVSFEKVKGHSTNPHNKLVDELAVEARKNYGRQK